MSVENDIDLHRYSGHPNKSTSIWSGVSDAAPTIGASAVLGDGTSAAAIEAVKNSDIAIVTLTPTQEGESHDRETLGFPADQMSFLKSLVATGTFERGLCLFF